MKKLTTLIALTGMLAFTLPALRAQDAPQPPPDNGGGCHGGGHHHHGGDKPAPSPAPAQ